MRHCAIVPSPMRIKSGDLCSTPSDGAISSRLRPVRQRGRSRRGRSSGRCRGLGFYPLMRKPLTDHLPTYFLKRASLNKVMSRAGTWRFCIDSAITNMIAYCQWPWTWSAARWRLLLPLAAPSFPPRPPRGRYRSCLGTVVIRWSWASLKVISRPGGNVTGITFLTHLLIAKRLELIHEIIPSATSIWTSHQPHCSLHGDRKTGSFHRGTNSWRAIADL